MIGLRSLMLPGLRAGRRICDRPQVLHSRAGPPGSPFPNNIGVCTVAGAAPCALMVASPAFRRGADRRRSSEEVMRNLYSYLECVGVENRVAEEAAAYASQGLPNRLLNAREVAKFVGCHEETVRRAYWRGLLRSQRFGIRGRRFHPDDVLDWISRGAPTKVS
jgi:excisionase family DNA binding protein